MIPLLLWFAGSAHADDALLEALTRWSERSVAELRLQSLPPTRSVLATLDQEQYYAHTSFGALVSEAAWRSRPTRVDVVVGDPRLDSSRYQMPGQRGGSRSSANLVTEDVPLAIDRDLWLTTDHAYKSAAALWQVKSAALATVADPDRPLEWTPADPVVSVQPAALETFDTEALRSLAIAASAGLRQLEGLKTGAAEVRALRGNYYLVTSEGTQVVQPEETVVVYAWATHVRPDGVELYDQVRWVALRPDDLPDAAQIAQAVEEMGRRVVARAQAPVVPYYEGPVVFEGEAAADLFRYLVAGELEGTPPAPEAGRSYAQLVRNGPRLGRRLLPDGWSVWDDPGRPEPGGFRYDREGVEAERLSLVEDGYVRDLAMSRVPRAELAASNGHARGTVQGDWWARLSAWGVEPDRLLSERAFARKVDRARQDAGLEVVLVVRRLARGREGALPSPTEAVWRLADGSEVPVVRLSFENVDRRALRDVVAAHGQLTRSYLAGATPGARADRTQGLATTLTAPERVLVSELEAVFPGPDSRPPSYPMPAIAGD